jgi:anti-anti-sigma factor
MEPKIYVATTDQLTVLQLRNVIRFDQCCSLNQFIEQYYAADHVAELLIDLTHATFLDSTALGAIAQIAVQAKARGLAKTKVIVNHPDLIQILKSVCFDQVFDLIEQPLAEHQSILNNAEFFEAIDTKKQGQGGLARAILNAHQQLMALSESNRQRFQEVSDILDKETDKSMQ